VRRRLRADGQWDGSAAELDSTGERFVFVEATPAAGWPADAAGR